MCCCVVRVGSAIRKVSAVDTISRTEDASHAVMIRCEESQHDKSRRISICYEKHEPDLQALHLILYDFLSVSGVYVRSGSSSKFDLIPLSLMTPESAPEGHLNIGKLPLCKAMPSSHDTNKKEGIFSVNSDSAIPVNTTVFWTCSFAFFD